MITPIRWFQWPVIIMYAGVCIDLNHSGLTITGHHNHSGLTITGHHGAQWFDHYRPSSFLLIYGRIMSSGCVNHAVHPRGSRRGYSHARIYYMVPAPIEIRRPCVVGYTQGGINSLDTPHKALYVGTNTRILLICYIFGYKRVYLPLYKVADTPFHIQGDK